jgi:hypothetical protein
MSTKTVSKSPSKTANATEAKANTKAKVKTSATKRIEYNFPLDFPSKPFTVRELKFHSHRNARSITLYARIQKAIGNGILEEAGRKVPAKVRKGRHEIIYQRVNAAAVVSAPVSAVEATPAVVETPVTVAETTPVVTV